MESSQALRSSQKTSAVAIRQVTAANAAADGTARLYTTNPVRMMSNLSDAGTSDSGGKKSDRKYSSSRKNSTLRDAGNVHEKKIFGSVCVRPTTKETPGRRFSYFSFWDGQVPKPMRFGGIEERSTTKSSSEAKRQQTYQLVPNQEARFNVDRVEKVLDDILEQRLTESKYDPRAASFAAQHLCESIKERVKEMNLDRYKVVVKVVIGSVSGGDLMMASRCLWSDFDNFASSTFRNSSLFAIALVYGIYFD